MKTLVMLLGGAVAAAALSACSGASEKTAKLTESGLDPEKFIAEFQGDSTALYTLRNANGMEVCVTNFGGRIVSLSVPDRDAKLRDVVLGFDSVQAYFPENNLTDFGASIGRYANRINQGRFTLNDSTYQLPQNNFGHCLHGGTDMGTLGWQYRVYKAEQPSDTTVILTLESADGDNGFPGNVKATVTYTLTADNAVDIAYSAVTDKPTIINMTNHSYFNLSGDPTKPVTDELLWVNAEGYTPVDSTYMTLGTIEKVEGTPFDFRTPKTVGQDIAADNEQIHNGNGYDHNFVLESKGDITIPALKIEDPVSGIVMEMFTTEYGVQIYSGNFLDGTVTGKKGIKYAQRTGICFESQHYPDSPNKPQWPTTVLNPGDTYHSRCIYRFSVSK